MDLYRLIGRIVVASVITSIIAVPLMFLVLGSIEQWPLLVIVLILIILVAIKTSNKDKYWIG